MLIIRGQFWQLELLIFPSSHGMKSAPCHSNCQSWQSNHHSHAEYSNNSLKCNVKKKKTKKKDNLLLHFLQTGSWAALQSPDLLCKPCPHGVQNWHSAALGQSPSSRGRTEPQTPGQGLSGGHWLKDTSLGPSPCFLELVTQLMFAKLPISLFNVILFSKAASLHKGLGI